jgi:hypothetical protein
VSLCVGWVSYVASAIGIPLHTDLTTLMCQRLNYTRVCIDINASKMLVREFNLLCPNGMLIAISVEYEWLPCKCSGCNVFGHTLATCPNNKRLRVLVQHMTGQFSLNGKKL